MTNTLLLLLYFSMPVMIYAAPQLDILQGLTGGGVSGVGSLNGGLAPVSNTISGGGIGALGDITGTVTRGGLLGRSQNAAEKLEGLGGSDRT
ncbi:hypothetical protein AGABI2DRAFT_190113 [Agaricus bisporus var. bisporus H97]|uniref:hypothetical protein n=1 Tax=Agaricus bisporus var. bisporus (strain H97 / ATCC MYA-4626 / FGSC 10389) TaxID=936046 RepID=UPI00029F6B58|nr:hypothetical protein AGABI2DRAFT_190113 [Agaricus bisporus var. bisporus H97]EKV51969.1 hypothetical protein AGABI2DRAFT_190113 [Agaricus bisporus var. bisporus H97]